MLRKIRIYRSVLILTCAVVCFAGASSPDAYAQQGAGGSYHTAEKKAERHRRAREEEEAQRRTFKINKLLEKARKERAVNNFKRARGYASQALRLEKDNPEAIAFLEQMDTEEKLYEEDKERVKAEKEREKLAKEETRRLAKEKKLEKKLAKKEAAEETRRKEKEKIEAGKRAQKIKTYLEKAEEYLEKDRFVEARGNALKATALDEENPDARALLKRIDDAEIIFKKKQERPEEREEEEKPGKPEKAEKEEDVKEEKEEKRPEKKEEAPPDDLLKLMKPGQPIIVDGDKVEYFEEEGKIVAEDNVSITYGEVKLTCDRIEVNTRTRQALCEGNVRIEQADGTLTGDRIRYDFARKRGEIIGGEVEAFPWFGCAEETGKVGPNEYLLKKGYITTCDLNKPHYRIAGEEIRVFPDDKVIARNVVMYIGKVPVMWFPYYYHPIIQTRAKVQFIPGTNTDWGYFVLSAWRFYVKGNSKVDVLLDYREKKGFGLGENFYYNASDFGMPGLGEGIFRSYFIYQNGFGTYDPTAFRGEGTEPVWRKRFQWKHRIEFDPGTVGILEFNKLSDEYVLKDYFYNEYEENSPIPANYISIISSKSNYIFSIEANKRFNDFYTVTQRMPELKLEIPDQRLWDTPLYYSSVGSATLFEKEYARDQNPPEQVARLDSSHKLSLVTNLGPLNLTPYGTFRGTVYDHRKWSGQTVARVAVGGGLDAFMRFHRVFDYNTNALGLDINGIRHIIVPSAMYYHMHQPSVDKDTLYQMDAIDTLEKRNGITFSLENKLQTKRHHGKQLKSADLLRCILSVDYLFRMKKNNYQFQDDGKFRNLKLDVELSPNNWLYVDSRMEITPKNQAVKTCSIETSVHPSDSFRLALGYRYEKMNTSRNQLTFDMDYVISPKWKIGLYERFDIEEGTIEEQQLSLIRDLHCWEVELTYNVDGGNFLKDKFTFWLAFRIKAFPDLYLGLSRSFTKRPAGSAYR
ncbi:MAG: LPS assembly protein LptD [Candidatus Omnitrophota bacterium]|nr:LPS assembly protein LptD [Candidatus Omnitrophota bacterium]